VTAARAMFFLADLGGGGAQRTLLNVASSIDRDVFAVDLVLGQSNGPARAWLDPRLQVHELRKNRLVATVHALTSQIRASAPDVVLSTMIDANVISFFAAKCAMTGAAVVLRETNSHRARGDVTALRRRLAGLAYRRADLVVALSEGVRRELIADMGLDAGRVVTIPNPVAVSDFADRAGRARLASPPWTVPQGSPCIVSVGRLHRQKGFDVLIDALAGHAPRAHLFLLGEGPERHVLAAHADRLGWSDHLHMPGFVEDVVPYLAHADMFVLPSRWEGFGHVIVEAMAAGVPVVAADCPYGPGEILEHESTGLLVPVENAPALGAAVTRLLDDCSLGQRLAQAAAKAAERYEMRVVATEYAGALTRAVINRRSRVRRSRTTLPSC